MSSHLGGILLQAALQEVAHAIAPALGLVQPRRALGGDVEQVPQGRVVVGRVAVSQLQQAGTADISGRRPSYTAICRASKRDAQRVRECRIDGAVGGGSKPWISLERDTRALSATDIGKSDHVAPESLERTRICGHWGQFGQARMTPEARTHKPDPEVAMIGSAMSTAGPNTCIGDEKTGGASAAERA